MATATLLDGLTIVKNEEGKMDTRFMHICISNPKFIAFMRTWGEAGTVKIKTKTTTKVENRGVHCMFVGYSLDHPSDCY